MDRRIASQAGPRVTERAAVSVVAAFAQVREPVRARRGRLLRPDRYHRSRRHRTPRFGEERVREPANSETCSVTQRAIGMCIGRPLPEARRRTGAAFRYARDDEPIGRLWSGSGATTTLRRCAVRSQDQVTIARSVSLTASRRSWSRRRVLLGLEAVASPRRRGCCHAWYLQEIPSRSCSTSR